jgi:hypothetical protein
VNAVTIIIYVFSASFVLMSVAMLFAYRRTGYYGLFMMGLTYGASAGLALALMHWWPLILGYALVWVLKWLGLDPDGELRKRQKESGAVAGERAAQKSDAKK